MVGGFKNIGSFGNKYIQKAANLSGDGLKLLGVDLKKRNEIPGEISRPITKKERVINKLTAILGAQFSTPEFKIISEGDESMEMMFIQTGDCIVNLRDHNFKEAPAIRLLTQGSMAGEIGLIFEGARRSADIICRNYVTMAVLSH